MRIKQSFKDKVRNLLEGQHHLIPMFTNVFYIPERIYEYDPSFFVVYNTRHHRYEIHCTEHFPTTHAVTLPYKELDVRAVRHLWYNDIRMQGDKVLKKADKYEERLEKEKAREEKNFIESFAREFKSEFAKDSWTWGT